MNAQSSDNGKLVAILSYFWFIGWIIAFILHGNQRTSLGAFHLRQALGISLVSLAIYLLHFFLHFIPFIGGTIYLILRIGLLVFWVLGLVYAIQGEQKTVPVIGDTFQRTFNGIS